MPIWQDLPFRFKQNVVGKLDFRSRLSLQKCSKSESNLVNTVPHFFSSILLNLSPDTYDMESDDDISDNESLHSEPPKTELLILEKQFTKGIYWKTENEDSTISTLKSILQNSNYRFWDMIFSKDGNPSRFINLLLDNINENFRFHVHKLTWNSIDIARSPEQIETCLKFFSLFDIGTLRKLEINFSNKLLISQMMRTNQFQNLKEIFINSEIENVDLEKLFDAKRFKVRVGEVIPEELKKIVEVFLKKSRGSYFKISTDETQIDLGKLLEIFGTMPRNSAVETDSFYERDTNTHRFEISDSEKTDPLVLYMKIRRNDLWGVVCRSEHIIKDFSVCPYY